MRWTSGSGKSPAISIIIYQRLERLEQEYQAILEGLRRIERLLTDERGKREVLEQSLDHLKREVAALQTRIEELEQRIRRRGLPPGFLIPSGGREHHDPQDISTRLPADIEERLGTLGRALEKCPRVVFAYVFGSAAAGRLGPLSDVDVAVYLEDAGDPIEGRLEAIGAITAHLGTDEVDLVVLNTAPTALVGRVLQNRRVICDREPFRRHRFESLALREFLDFRIFEHRLLARRYASG